MLAYPAFERIVLNRIVAESRLPARVVFGFGGYANEAELRKGVAALATKLGAMSHSSGVAAEINAFPNLIVCGRAAVIKLDGLPYPGVFHEGDQYWGWLGSNSGNPLLALLEILWTRLRARFGISADIFGEDLATETVRCFGLFSTVDREKNVFGLDYLPDLKDGDTEQSGAEWEPAELTEAEFEVINGLALGLEAGLDDPEFKAFLTSHSVDADELVSSLREKGLAGLRGRKIVPLSATFRTAMLSDRRFVAADDSTGRMSAFLAKRARENVRARGR